MTDIESAANVYDYNPDTGVFHYRCYRSPTAQKGQEAGYLSREGFKILTLDGRRYPASHIAYLFMTDSLPTHEVTYLDKNPQNTRWDNLALNYSRPLKDRPQSRPERQPRTQISRDRLRSIVTTEMEFFWQGLKNNKTLLARLQTRLSSLPNLPYYVNNYTLKDWDRFARQ